MGTGPSIRPAPQGFGSPGIDGHLYKSASARRMEATLGHGLASQDGNRYPVSAGRDGQILFIFAAAPLSPLPVPGGVSDGDCFVRFPLSALPAGVVYLPSHIGGVVFSMEPFVIAGSTLEVVLPEETRQLQKSPIDVAADEAVIDHAEALGLIRAMVEAGITDGQDLQVAANSVGTPDPRSAVIALHRLVNQGVMRSPDGTALGHGSFGCREDDPRLEWIPEARELRIHGYRIVGEDKEVLLVADVMLDLRVDASPSDCRVKAIHWINVRAPYLADPAIPDAVIGLSGQRNRSGQNISVSVGLIDSLDFEAIPASDQRTPGNMLAGRRWQASILVGEGLMARTADLTLMVNGPLVAASISVRNPLGGSQEAWLTGTRDGLVVTREQASGFGRPVDSLIVDASMAALETGLAGDLEIFRGFWTSAD